MASCDSVCEMPSADRLDEPSLLSLPDDLIVQLFYRLDNQRDVCMFELVSKRIRNVLSELSEARGEGCLDLGTEFPRDRPQNPDVLR